MHEYEAGFIGLKALADHLQISIRTIHRIIASGEVASIKVGRRRLVSRSAVSEWLSGMAEQGAK